MKQALKTIAKRTRLYPAYRSIAERNRIQRMRRQFWEPSVEDGRSLSFYSRFVSDGDVVFDVGANLGNRAKVFSLLGATVVAVEPQSSCAEFLMSVFQGRENFHLVRKALGASVGQAEMMISSESTISSLSPDWVRSVTASGRFADKDWNRKEMVSIDTLDNLIAQYGRPAFVKVDVEGFEDQVVSGLSTSVGALSMEFTPEYSRSTLNCIDHLSGIGECQFQISLGETLEFHLSQWVSADEIKIALSNIPSAAFGDLYARFA